MATETDRSHPGEPVEYGEGAEGFPHGSKYPLFVAAGMFFTALGLLWLPVLIVGIPVLLYGMLGWIHEYTVGEYETGIIPEQKRERLGLTTNYLAMVLVVIGELLVFSAVFIAYLYLEATSGPFPPAGSPEPSMGFGLGLLAVLLIGSLAMYRSRQRIQLGDRAAMKQGLAITTLAGLAFVAILSVEWLRLWTDGLHWDVIAVGTDFGVYGSVFFLTTGLHLFHVIGGLGLLGILLYRVFARGHFSEQRFTMIATTEVYWHMLALVQLLIVVIVYM